MVSNVTAMPPMGAPLPTVRAGPAVEGEKKAGAQSAAAVLDPTRVEHREDVLSAREDVADARHGLDFAGAVGRQARALLLEARDVALRAADPAAPDAARTAQDVSFRGLVQQIGQLVEAAIAEGAPLVGGDPLSVRADPDSDAAVDIAGFDIRLKSAVTGDEALLLTRGASVADATSAREALGAAQQSLARLDAGLARIDAESGRLGQHDKVLAALDAALASNVAPDLDADGARLLALQVRQDLSAHTGPIANARPNAVLALFRD
jgi:predicted transcriptional regulator